MLVTRKILPSILTIKNPVKQVLPAARTLLNRAWEIGQTPVNRSSLNKAGAFVKRRMTPFIAACVISSAALLTSCAGETRKQIPCPEKKSALLKCYEK